MTVSLSTRGTWLNSILAFHCWPLSCEPFQFARFRGGPAPPGRPSQTRRVGFERRTPLAVLIHEAIHHDTHTEDFEHVLDGDGIRGVSYEPDDETVVVLVEEKLPESELADTELISTRVPDQRTDVVEVGDITAQPSVHPDVENAETQGDPAHRSDEEERPLFERAGVTLREIDAPDDVSLEGV